MQSLSLYLALSLLRFLSLFRQRIRPLRNPYHRGFPSWHVTGERSSKGVDWLEGSSVETNSLWWQSMQRAWPSSGFPTLYRRLWPSPASVQGPKQFFFASSSQWYSSFTTKVVGSSRRFSVHKRQTLLVDSSQTEPYFEVTISNLYSWRKMLSNTI